MIKWFAKRRIDAFENAFEYDMSHARQLLDASPKALMAFGRAAELSTYRGDLPTDVWHVARVVAIRVGDCGPCAQLMVKMAEADGVDPELLRAALMGDFEALPSRVALAARFAHAALRRDEQVDELRDMVAEVLGPSGLVALCLTVTGTTLYPTLKYALGYGRACSTLRVGGRLITPNRIETDTPAPMAHSA
jgi:hypothetical protein